MMHPRMGLSNLHLGIVLQMRFGKLAGVTSFRLRLLRLYAAAFAVGVLTQFGTYTKDTRSCFFDSHFENMIFIQTPNFKVRKVVMER